MKNKHLRRLLITVTALLLISSLISCSSGSDAKNESILPNEAEKGEVMDGMTAVGDSNNSLAHESNGAYERKIIRTVDMSCETKSFDAAIEHILSTLTAHDGYVEASSVSGSGFAEEYRAFSSRYATYTLRVPAEKLDTYLADLRANDGIRIIKQSSTSDEITNAYYDITTRLATLETERESLSQMLAGFTDYKDINAMLAVQERLYNVIEEIEALKTKLNMYDQQVDLSTIHLSINEVGTYTEAATPTFGERVAEAFSESWTDFARGCQNFAVGFISAFPTLLVLAVIISAVLAILLSILRKRRKKKAAERADENK